MFDPTIMRRAVGDSFVKLNPRHLMRNPVMFVVEVGSVLTTVLFFTNLSSASTDENVFAALVAAFLWFTVLVRELRRGRRRRAWEGAGGHAPQDAFRDDGEPPHGRRDARAGAGHPTRSRRRGRGRGRRGDPERRRRRRGHREHRRVGDHGRVGAGDPGGGRRPLRGDRRDPGAVGPDRRAHHGPARRDLHRSDDRARRGVGTSEDAERDRARTSCSPGSRSSSCSRR